MSSIFFNLLSSPLQANNKQVIWDVKDYLSGRDYDQLQRIYKNEMGSESIKELCEGISFNLSNSAQPAYGYASQEFDMVLPGRKLLQGSFVVNYTEANYLSEKISSLRGDTVGDITDRNELFDIMINYGTSNAKRNLLLKNCYLISRGQTIQISEQVILEEFSFIGQAVRNDTPSRRAQQSRPVLNSNPKIQPNPNKKQTKQNTKVEAEILIVFDNYKSFDVDITINGDDSTLGETTREKLEEVVKDLSKNPRFNLSFAIINRLGGGNEITLFEDSQTEAKLINYLGDVQEGEDEDFWDEYQVGNIRLATLTLQNFLESSGEKGPSTPNKKYLLFYIAGDDVVYNEENLAHTVDMGYPWVKKVLFLVSEDGSCNLSKHQNVQNGIKLGVKFKENMGWLVNCVGIGSQFSNNNLKDDILLYLNEEYSQ